MRHPDWKLFPALVSVVCGQVVEAQTSSCQWPMQATLIRDQPSASSSMTLLKFTPDPGVSGEIVIEETTIVDVSDSVRNVRSLVEASPQWQQLQSSLSCQKRLSDVQISAWPEGDGIRVKFSGAAESFWCASSNVPCPTWDKPFRFCVKETSGKVWGARTESQGLAVLRFYPGSGVKVEMTDVRNRTATSPEQDFVRNAVGSMFAGPIGSDVLRSFETRALREISMASADGIQQFGLMLSDGSPADRIPNYRPQFQRAFFRANMGAPKPGGGPNVSAVIVRQARGVNELLGCSVARKLGGGIVPKGPRRNRGG